MDAEKKEEKEMNDESLTDDSVSQTTSSTIQISTTAHLDIQADILSCPSYDDQILVDRGSVQFEYKADKFSTLRVCRNSTFFWPEEWPPDSEDLMPSARLFGTSYTYNSGCPRRTEKLDLAVGDHHVVKATPYDGPNCDGAPGVALEHSFRVIDSDPQSRCSRKVTKLSYYRGSKFVGSIDPGDEICIPRGTMSRTTSDSNDVNALLHFQATMAPCGVAAAAADGTTKKATDGGVAAVGIGLQRTTKSYWDDWTTVGRQSPYRLSQTSSPTSSRSPLVPGPYRIDVTPYATYDRTLGFHCLPGKQLYRTFKIKYCTPKEIAHEEATKQREQEKNNNANNNDDCPGQVVGFTYYTSGNKFVGSIQDGDKLCLLPGNHRVRIKARVQHCTPTTGTTRTRIGRVHLTLRGGSASVTLRAVDRKSPYYLTPQSVRFSVGKYVLLGVPFSSKGRRGTSQKIRFSFRECPWNE